MLPPLSVLTYGHAPPRDALTSGGGTGDARPYSGQGFEVFFQGIDADPAGQRALRRDACAGETTQRAPADDEPPAAREPDMPQDAPDSDPDDWTAAAAASAEDLAGSLTPQAGDPVATGWAVAAEPRFVPIQGDMDVMAAGPRQVAMFRAPQEAGGSDDVPTPTGQAPWTRSGGGEGTRHPSDLPPRRGDVTRPTADPAQPGREVAGAPLIGRPSGQTAAATAQPGRAMPAVASGMQPDPGSGQTEESVEADTFLRAADRPEMASRNATQPPDRLRALPQDRRHLRTGDAPPGPGGGNRDRVTLTGASGGVQGEAPVSRTRGLPDGSGLSALSASIQASAGSGTDAGARHGGDLSGVGPSMDGRGATGAEPVSRLSPVPQHHAAETARQVASQIREAVHKGRDGTIDLTLSPVELGRVRLSLSPGDGAVAVTILTDRPETLELMRRHIDLLAQDLREMGYGSASFSFGAGQGRHPHAPEPEMRAAAESEPLVPDRPETVTVGRALADGVDIRL